MFWLTRLVAGLLVCLYESNPSGDEGDNMRELYHISPLIYFNLSSCAYSINYTNHRREMGLTRGTCAAFSFFIIKVSGVLKFSIEIVTIKMKVLGLL